MHLTLHNDAIKCMSEHDNNFKEFSEINPKKN